MANKTLTDDELLIAIKAYLANNKHVTLNELRRKLSSSVERIERVAAAANITLPAKLSRSAGATLGRRKSAVCENWFINRPAPWQTTSKKSPTHERITA
ncbi:MAG TPA: hypothetical protein VIO56_03100 [Methylotenera sp.]